MNMYVIQYELNYNDQKIRRTPTHDIREHWTAVSTLLGFIDSVYRNLHHWRSNLSAENLQLSYQFISHPSDAKSTSHGNCAAK